MATTAPSQLDPTSLDLSGISVATSSPSEVNPRTGTAYDPVICAAAAPVWFHPMPGRGSHLMLSARTWSAATPGGDVGFYADYTETLEPSWFVLHGPTGARSFVPGWGPTIPVTTAVEERRLVAAASRAPDYLYLLHSAVIAGQPGALLQLIRVAPGGCHIYVEEVLPSIEGVVFDRGLQYQTPFLTLYGTDPGGAIHAIRKRWAEIGTTTRQSSGYLPAWEYFTGIGFSLDPTQAAPLPGVSSDGPLSFAAFRQMVLMSTVVASGTDYLGRVWESRQGRPFRATATSVNLGSSAESYLGHGLMLQPQLEANPLRLASASVSAGVPYVLTTKARGGRRIVADQHLGFAPNPSVTVVG